MTREEELKAEIARLQAELNQTPPDLLRISGKPAKIVYTKQIGRGRYQLNKPALRRVSEQQEPIPVIVVSEA
jgi:hypothetical protein